MTDRSHNEDIEAMLAAWRRGDQAMLRRWALWAQHRGPKPTVRSSTSALTVSYSGGAGRRRAG